MIAPALAPILLALNAAAIYIGVSASGAVGALAMGLLEPHRLPLLSAGLILCGIPSAELAWRLIRGGRATDPLAASRRGGSAPALASTPDGSG